MNLAAVVMAAGKGTRMRSNLPKVLHTILGKPLLGYALDTVVSLNPLQTAVIVGHEADRVRENIAPLYNTSTHQLSFVLQSPQLGTGHAIQMAQPALEGGCDAVVVTYGDMPLLTTQTLQAMIETYQSSKAAFVLLSAEVDDARGFGRIIRDKNGYVVSIVEEVDCTPEQKLIRELNVGAYVFNAEWLWPNLDNIPQSEKGEYYLTDLVNIAVQQGQRVIAQILEDPREVIGVNNRAHLAEASAAIQQRINRKWMEAGVTMLDPASTYIGWNVDLQPDTVIHPNTYLYGESQIGRDCEIGPHSYVVDSKIGDGCVITFSVIEQSTVEEDVDIGPFSHLRPGAHLAKGVHMGNFGEVKNSYLGPGTKMGHFSYLGDTTTGENVNIGAGTITCNYDGVRKNRTTLEDNAFIGSDTMLVAPVTVGKNARTGAGSVVTSDIPDESLAYGVPARVKKNARDAS